MEKATVSVLPGTVGVEDISWNKHRRSVESPSGNIFSGVLKATGTGILLKEILRSGVPDYEKKIENFSATITALAFMDKQVFGAHNVRVLGLIKDSETHYVVFEDPNSGVNTASTEPGDSTGSSSTAHITTLDDYMESRKSVLPKGQIMLAAFKMLTALKVYSDMHFVHNGLHMGNIFLSKSAGFVLGPPNIYPSAETFEMEGQLMEYMPPEVYSGDSHGLPTDMWDIGALCHQLIHYRYPRVDSTELIMSDHDFLSKHDRESVCQVADISLADVATSCTQPEPNMRPTCSQVYYSPVSLP